MHVLVFNAGSSSLKLTLFEVNTSQSSFVQTWNAHLDGWGKDADVAITRAGENHRMPIDATDDGSLEKLVTSIWNGESAPVSSPADIAAVGHRVVHGGTKYASSTVIDSAVVSDLAQYVDLAPQHEQSNIRGINIARKCFPNTPQVAVFDTAFHHNMPPESIVYAGPYTWYQDMGIRRIGFHGINHQYCINKCLKLLSDGKTGGRVISCHLGGGASLCASLNGKSISTTMGFTPLEGLVMQSRSGSIDPGLILHFLQKGIYSVDELAHILNADSGVKGISGLSGDMRELELEMKRGNERAELAFNIYVHSLSSQIASLVPTLGGLDAILFTGGVGENSSLVREETAKRLAFLGIEIDGDKNNGKHDVDLEISAASAKVRTFVIRASEERAIAQECVALQKTS